MSALLRMGLPARALQLRLQWETEPPSWASYLPPDVLSRVHAQTAAALESPTGASSCSDRLKGRVWELSQDPVGCREVQRALECAATEADREALAAELQGHICEAMRCPHANYVLQKCVSVMRPANLQFIIDELVDKNPGIATYTARHKYGCRIIQRILEHCPPSQLRSLAEHLLEDAVATCLHPYGNYVMQHLIEHGTAEQRHELSKLLRDNVEVVAADAHAGAVVGKAMTFGAEADKVELARALVRTPGLLPCIARSRHGHTAAKAVFDVLEGTEREQACGLIYAEEKTLRGLRYGQLVLASLKQDSRKCAAHLHAAAKAAAGGA